MSSAIPVLLYHSVSDRSTAEGRWGAVSKSRFAADVDALVASRRRTVSITALSDGLRGSGSLPDHPVAVTFDDGYDDTFEAVELLCASDLGSTVYVTTGQVGRPGRLSRHQLLDLAAMPGVEIGSHGVHHRRLDELSTNQICQELRESKLQLEDLLGAPVSTFAYPHGAYDRRVQSALIDAGYESAAAVKNAMCHAADDPFAIARWTVTASSTSSTTADILTGRGAPLAWGGERWRTWAYRAARRHRRRLVGGWRPEC